MTAYLGRWLFVVGVGIAVLGGILMLVGRFVPSGRLLPGDLVIRRPGLTVYLPLMTSVLVSVALTLILWVIALLRR
jgi:hypothetical protein